jgi:tetratricopeptide (TPR) repeat protein
MKIVSIFLLGFFLLSVGLLPVIADSGDAQQLIRGASDTPQEKAKVSYNKGLRYQKQGKFAQAIKEYQNALALYPDFAEAYNNLGYSYRMKGNFDQAIVSYKKALRLKPDLAEAHEYLAKAYLAKGMKAEAEAEYQILVKLNPVMAAEIQNLIQK